MIRYPIRAARPATARPRRRLHDARGQASVEFVATIPALLLATLVALQLAAVGWSAWSASSSARAGARAALVDDDVEDVSLAALPGVLREGASVEEGQQIEVTVSAPGLVPGLPRISVSGSARLDPWVG